jgi:hypothetical protein
MSNIAPTRITDIDRAIDRTKTAITYLGDSDRTTAILSDRLAELVIERAQILALKTGKVLTPKADVTPVATPKAPKTASKPAPKASKPAPKAPRKPKAPTVAVTPVQTTPDKPKFVKADDSDAFWNGPATDSQKARVKRQCDRTWSEYPVFATLTAGEARDLNAAMKVLPTYKAA